MGALPADLAREILDAGVFSFCSGSASSTSYKKFLQLHSLLAETVPDQRTAKGTAWVRINALKKEREATQQRALMATGVPYNCNDRILRVIRRLGVESQLLEAAGGDTPMDIIGDVEKITALASTMLTYAITTDQIVARVTALLNRNELSLYGRPRESALGLFENSTSLPDFLPGRFSSNISRLRSPGFRSGDRE